MATISTLNDPLVAGIVAHVFNKFRADVVGADGKLKANKKKFTLTESLLLSQYNLNVPKALLKSKQVSTAGLVHSCIETLTQCLTRDRSLLSGDAALPLH